MSGVAKQDCTMSVPAKTETMPPPPPRAIKSKIMEVPSGLGAVLNPSRFILSTSSSSSSSSSSSLHPPSSPSLGTQNALHYNINNYDESGSDRELTPRESSTPTSARGIGGNNRSGGGDNGHNKKTAEDKLVVEQVEETERSLERVRQNLSHLKTFVSEEPTKIANLTAQIEDLEKRKHQIKTREELSILHRICAVQDYLKAVRSMLIARIDEKLLQNRMTQMREYYDKIPASEKNDRSPIDAWNAMFDVHAIVPRSLAKDHCDYCKKPLILIRKQAQLQCMYCARMSEFLTPVAHANGWMKTNLNSQPENKRIKAVLAKLNQFLIGTPSIPDEIILCVRQALKSRSHISLDTMALPNGVAAALTTAGHEKYVPFATKIATAVNGSEACEITPEQINEIISRLRIAQFGHNILVSNGKLPSKHFFTNYAVCQIALVMQLQPLIASFPIQRPKRLLKEQSTWWKTLVAFLRQIDTCHRWP